MAGYQKPAGHLLWINVIIDHNTSKTKQVIQNVIASAACVSSTGSQDSTDWALKHNVIKCNLNCWLSVSCTVENELIIISKYTNQSVD